MAMENEKAWYALYVKSRSEKKVAAQLEGEGIEFYLPLEQRLKQWSDRKKWVEEPLFRSYIFVHISEKDYFRTLVVHGAVRYVTFEGKAVRVPPQQIEAIKLYLNEKEPVSTDQEHWEVGQKVEVLSGKLTGLQGKLVDVKGKKKVRIMIDVVNSALYLNLPKNQLRVIP
ncbi:MAG: UpxY family transcription antiterminator [Bacteroidales bacterium]|nr:UpxY family transcription antiterminator [Bacteroidales bacterium]